MFAQGRRSPSLQTFDPLEFLARVIMHIPEPRRHLVRYYGWYSNVSRGKRNKEEDEQSRPIEETADAPRIDGDRSADARSFRRSWAQLIKRIYEVDPLQCPSCGGEMKVVAFITEHEVVDRILRHLKRKEEGKERA
ncbi:MAG: transposase, partial [Myxococcales bacterium]|nr:transposase [Myxococcales bacterium]